MAPSTRRTYQTAFKKFTSFVANTLQQNNSLPYTQQQIHLYVAHLHSANYKHSTIVSNLSAISHYHKINLMPDPVSSYPTVKLLSGVRNSQVVKPDQRLPITRTLLLGLVTALTACAPTQYDAVLYHSMYTVMYYACLRASEVLQTDTPQHIITIENFTITTNSLNATIHLNSYKHAAHQSADILLTATSAIDCPIQATQKYLQLRPPTAGPLFISQHKQPVLRPAFLHTLTACLRYLNIAPDSYNIHSFRIGRTTDMAQQNVPHDAIQRIGRWKSNAYLKYIRPPPVAAQPLSTSCN